MPEIAEAPLGLSILYLIRQTESHAAATAQAMVARSKREIEDAALRTELVELIETVILYKLPRLSREEIQAMLQVHDIRETRVYQEAKEEDRKEGIETERQRSFQEKLRSIEKMAALKMSAETIADLLGLELDLVRKEMAKNPLEPGNFYKGCAPP
jgi:predicted transposase/invertase (TIGR01784 family)